MDNSSNNIANFQGLPLKEKASTLLQQGTLIEKKEYYSFILESYSYNGKIYEVYNNRSNVPMLVGECLEGKGGRKWRIVKYQDLINMPTLNLLYLILTTNDDSISYILGENDNADIFKVFGFYALVPFAGRSNNLIEIEISQHEPPPPSDYYDDDRSDFTNSKHYNDNLDLDQQSAEFWDDI